MRFVWAALSAITILACVANVVISALLGEWVYAAIWLVLTSLIVGGLARDVLVVRGPKC